MNSEALSGASAVWRAEESVSTKPDLKLNDVHLVQEIVLAQLYRMTLLKRSLLISAALLGSFCVCMTGVWSYDNRVLRKFGVEVLDIKDDKPITGQVIERANARLARYIESGHAGHFLVPGIRATAVQVLERGGDCADRSRLLTTVLSEYGVRATMVMLSPCTGCPFVHTVVEAISADGRIVVDPTYGIAFRKPGGGYYDIRDLRRDLSIVKHEVASLRVHDKDKQAYADFVRQYLGYFNEPQMINFGAGMFGRGASRIVGMFADEPELIYRSRLLEDPILLLILFSSGGTLMALAAWGALTLRERRHMTVQQSARQQESSRTNLQAQQSLSSNMQEAATPAHDRRLN